MKPSVIVWDLETVPTSSGSQPPTISSASPTWKCARQSGTSFRSTSTTRLSALEPSSRTGSRDHWAVDAIGASGSPPRRGPLLTSIRCFATKAEPRERRANILVTKMVTNTGPRACIERDGTARAADFRNTNHHLSGQNETGGNGHQQILSAVPSLAPLTLNGCKEDLFGLIAFVGHRARPPNVGKIVGSERRNANHVMISMGLGGHSLRQKAVRPCSLAFRQEPIFPLLFADSVSVLPPPSFRHQPSGRDGCRPRP